MRTTFIFAILATLACAEPVRIGSYDASDGVSLRWDALPEQFAQTASWTGRGVCPFDIPKLTEIAFEYAKQNVEKPERLVVYGISLNRAQRAGKVLSLNDKWYVSIDFGGVTGTFPGSVHILPDGTIIEPKAKLKRPTIQTP